jgi:hypothetical protein
VGFAGKQGKHWPNTATRWQFGNTKKQFTTIVSTTKHKDIMSRSNAPTARPLSLMEELEKLEQSITLTLQGLPRRTQRWSRPIN